MTASPLRDALDRFAPPLFRPLPPSRIRSVRGDAPPVRPASGAADWSEIGEALRTALSMGRAAELRHLALRAGLCEPAAVEAMAASGHARLVEVAILRDDPRSARAVLHAHLVTFATGTEATHRLADALRRLSPRLGRRWSAALDRWAIADADAVLARLAQAFGRGERDLADLLALRPALMHTRLGAVALAAAIEAAAGSGDEIERMLTLARLPDGSLPGAVKGVLYPALVRPYFDDAPGEAQKRRIAALVSAVYRDPRLPTTPRPTLDGDDGTLAERCVVTVKRWLAVETLRLFVEVINEAAQEQWEMRRDFWLPYFEAGMVTDVQVAFASQAVQIASRIEARNRTGMQWATLQGAMANQSVLLLRIERLTIAEWSHSGALRFWFDPHGPRPRLGRERYEGAELRQGSSPVCDEFGREHDGIRHDPAGRWRALAARVIAGHTGLRP